ncbi:hypothetical protein D8674_028577 [Pyrus ussuriensis x Pyrus communis]|uniref:Uncharacterized protein n=1 Tax=Pyrus ussuriensis x Pyrus communis TaxID=2448454 RepID=A0A5N5I3Z1_9ROSA|nr:hypothetical protein D8674_028577 [Pyrus ussuriensis x Pyrus communis]
MAVLSFWCSASNTMVFPLGPLSPTILDINAILGTSSTGLLVDISLTGYKFDWNLKTVFEERTVEALTKGDQRCPLLFLTSHSLLSLERISGLLEKECELAEEFTDRRTKFCLRPRNLESRCANTFAKWWKAYNKDLFHMPAEEILQKLFDGHPKKVLTPKSKETAQGSHVIKRAEVVAMAAAKKKLAPHPKKVVAAVSTMPSKRLYREAEMEGDVPRPKERVKKLAKNGFSLPYPVVEVSLTVQLYPTIELAINPVVERLMTSALVAALAEAGLSESPQLVVETTSRVKPPSVEVGPNPAGAPLVEPEAITETPSKLSLFCHSSSLIFLNIHISLMQPLWEVELDALLASSSGTAGP